MLRRRLLSVVAVSGLAFAARVAGAQARATEPDPRALASAASIDGEAIEKSRAMVRAIMTRTVSGRRGDGSAVEIPNHIPGMTVAVGVRGRVVWTEGFGVADIERRVPATPETRYRIGSLSKLITATTLMRLAETRRIDLDAPIQNYVPSFPRKQAPITARLLAGHLSGVRHYRIPGDPIGTRAYKSLEEGLQIFASDTLLFAPATRYSYSSYGYNLLGVALEGAAKAPYIEVVRQTVLRPLSMWSTTLDYRDSIVPNRATPYDYGRDQRVINAPYDDQSYKWPSGGFVSTAGDLVTLGMAHLSPGLLSAQSLATAFTTQRTADGKETGVGIGWRIARDSSGRTYYHHAGASNPGGRGVLVVFPREQIVVAMLANILANFDDKDAAAMSLLWIQVQ